MIRTADVTNKKETVFGWIVFALLHLLFAGYIYLYLPQVFAFLGVWGMAALLVYCIFAVDFGTGFYHWLFDNYGEGGDTLAGKIVLNEFREHHTDEMKTCRNPLIVVYLPSALGASLLILACHTLAWLASDFWQMMILIAVLSHYIGTFTTIVHVLAHRRKAGWAVPPWVAWLQDKNILLNSAHHDRHHQDPSGTYGIMFMLLNNTLDRTRFWRRLERLLEGIGIRKAV